MKTRRAPTLAPTVFAAGHHAQRNQRGHVLGSLRVRGSDTLSPYYSPLKNSGCHAWGYTPTYLLSKEK